MTRILTLMLLLGIFVPTQAANYSLTSPNGEITIRVQTSDKIYYAVDVKGKNILWDSPLSMSLVDGKTLGHNPKVSSNSERSVDSKIQTVWGIRKEVIEQYKELTLKMEGKYSVIFRAYDDGIAYRFHTDLPGKIKIKSEEVSYHFLKNHDLLAHVVSDFQTSYEKLYTEVKIQDVVEKDFISLPLLMDQGDLKVVITEADLYDYPGMYIRRLDNNNRSYLDGLFPQLPSKWEKGGWCQFNLKVLERNDYLAETDGTRDFPWRCMIIAEEDRELADNDLVYKLSRPAAIETDWIKPGMVSWDWWNDWNLSGVDFEAGINTQTYKYYIDFASENDLEYIILDDGWSAHFNLLLPKPDVDVPELVAYGKEKNVKIMLWCVWHTLDRQMQEALDAFEEWGIAGIKVDFIDRDDQIAINYYERLAAEAAKRKILVDYHGCSKPTGLHRTYPNVINYESVRGNEYNKFDKDETPDHDVDIVFTRMIAGPMDYTPGAMNNSTKGNYHMDNSNPMSHGTRAHQLGMYVVYYSPLQMLCDAPTAYEAEPELLPFFADVPTTWDETVVLNAKLGEYVVIARQKGKDWYIGALSDWSERTLEVDLSFLGKGSYDATLYLDGINANRRAEDYRIEKKTLNKNSKLSLTLKSGGGAAMVLKRK